MALNAGETVTEPQKDEPAVAGPLIGKYRREVVVVLAVFAASRLAYALAGVRFDLSALHPRQPGLVQWQLLPLNLLHHDLLRSVWHLHSQPPLYNLFCGMLLHLPGPVGTGDQYIWLAPNYGRISGYARVYDAVVLAQPRFTHDMASVAALLYGAHPPPADLSWTIVAVTLVDLLAAPVVIYRRRRDGAWAAPMAFLWVTVTYSFVVTTATEMSENMRFHFELGTLPVVLAVATVASLLPKRTVPPVAPGSPTAS